MRQRIAQKDTKLDSQARYDTPTLALGVKERSPSKRNSQVLIIGWLNIQSLTKKSTTIRELIADRCFDIFIATETCHQKGQDLCLKQVCCNDYSVAELSRGAGKGGGIAILYRSFYKRKQIVLHPVTTFEYVCNCFVLGASEVVILAVYRPGSKRPTGIFFEEFSSLLEMLVLEACTIIIDGDFNIRVQNGDDPDTRRLSELLDTFSMIQNVKEETHRNHGTLNLVIPYSDDKTTVEVEVDPTASSPTMPMSRCLCLVVAWSSKGIIYANQQAGAQLAKSES